MTANTFDLAVIGAGPGGYVAAIRGAQLGMRTAIIEKSPTLGGTCLNIGCIPSKALLHSSELYHQAKKQFKRHGIIGDFSLDLKAMLRRKDGVVKQLTLGIAHLMKKNNIEVFAGLGQLRGEGKLAVLASDGSETLLAASHIIIATGSEPIELPFARFDGERVVSSTEALSFADVPEHLVVIGAGAIGLELGSVWRRLGAQVTVVEMLPRIAPSADREAADVLQKALQAQGLKFLLEARLLAVESEGGLRAVVEQAGSRHELSCDRLLVAVGRRAHTAHLGLEAVGLQTDRAGRIEVDEHFRTAVPGLYAIGDVIRGPMLAHKAEDEGAACVELLAGKAGHVNYQTIPSVIYTWPELASTGQSEEQLQEAGIAYRRGSFPFMANGRAKAANERDGMVKILAASDDDRLLGVHIVGPQASELIAEAVTVMEFGGSSEDIARTVHAHPTLSETVREAALAVDGRALHI